jgi:cytochrome c peroxidase
VLTNPFNSSGEFSDDRTTGRLAGVAMDPNERGKWRTKGLRNVTKHPVFMHTGQFTSLQAVVEFYNQGGHEAGFVGVKDEQMKKLNLTDAEMTDLVAFLETLAGEEIPETLRVDTSAK